MRTRHVLAVATAVLLAMLALGGAPAAGAAQRVTFRVTSITTAESSGNHGATVRVHDHLLATDRAFGTAAGEVVGTDQQTIHRTGASAGTFTGTAFLPGGTVRISGRYDARTMTIRVTGGTGHYERATGSVVTAKAGNGAGDPTTNIYRLRLPNGTGPLPRFGVKTV